MARNQLTDKIRAQVVSRFASWESYDEILAWLKEEHGIEVGKPALVHYNMDNPLSRSEGTRKWVELFDQVRTIQVSRRDSIRTAHPVERMRIIDSLITKLLRSVDGTRGGVNLPVLGELLKQLDQQRKETEALMPRRAGSAAAGGDGGGDAPQSPAEQARRIREALFQMDESMNAAGEAT